MGHPRREYFGTQNGAESYKKGEVVDSYKSPAMQLCYPMTYPRAHLVDSANGGFYHCISRCVRQGWLCGADPVSGRSYEHRKDWVESRLLKLSEVFAVDVYSYAVMSNHYHVVLEVDPRRTSEWCDEEVARRWLRLSPEVDELRARHRREALMSSRERVSEVRKRLGSLSWFMRYLNEPIARAANREDGCSGRFWEGRFRSIALLDEGAIVGCMAYVDLNPVRAKVARRVEESANTSVRRRILRGERGSRPLGSLSALGLTMSSYRGLLEWTVEVDRGSVAEPAERESAVLQRLGHDPAAWLSRVKSHHMKYRAYGALKHLRRYAQKLGQHWIKGLASNSLSLV